jgi:hypothetical protein
MSLSASLIWMQTFTDWFFVSSFGPYKRVSQLGSAITLIFWRFCDLLLGAYPTNNIVSFKKI